MDSHEFQGSEVGSRSGRGPALEKILLDPSWLLFHRFIDECSWRATDLNGSDAWRLVAIELQRGCIGALPLGKPLLDPSWVIFIDFIDSSMLAAGWLAAMIDSSMLLGWMAAEVGKGLLSRSSLRSSVNCGFWKILIAYRC